MLHPFAVAPLVFGLLEVEQAEGLAQRLAELGQGGKSFVDSIVDFDHAPQIGAR